MSEIKSSIKAFKECVDIIIIDISQNKDQKKLNNELVSIEAGARSIYELILSVELSHIVETFEEAKKEYAIVKAKICQIDGITRKPKVTLKDLGIIIKNRAEIEIAIRNERDKLVEYFMSDDFKKLSDRVSGEEYENYISKAIYGVNTKVNEYKIAYQEKVNAIWSKIESIKSLRDKIKKIEDELYANVYDGVSGYKELLQKRLKQYENKLKENLSQEALGVVGVLKNKIRDIENQIISEPDREDLRNLLIQLKYFYNTLTSLSKKEINYTWQTASFKNADFGIVSFLASNNPKTSLSVNVKNTIYFQANKFPAVIQRV